MKTIAPKLLKGFRDFSPRQQTLRLLCIDTLQKVFSQFGFLPMDTPILEYEEVLLGKGGGETDKQVYRFEDNGKRNVVMRFDLTVPFARYTAMNESELPIPFFRSQVGKVFRGENTQQGRYREFMQCDFDIIGVDHISSDMTIIQLIIASFESLHLPHIKVHLSHRGLFNEFLETQTPLSRPLEEASIETLRIVDKIRKIGEEKTQELLQSLWDEKTVEKIIAFGKKERSNEQTLEKLKLFVGEESPHFLRLQALYQMAQTLNIASHIVIDPSITRGLDYYTGVVYETFVSHFEHIGSVCSGGRYNNLTQLFSEKDFPGAGASIGLDRLLVIIAQTNSMTPTHEKKSVIVFAQDERAVGYCHTVMQSFHKEGLTCHVYPLSKKIKSFFKYTEQAEADFACIIGTDEYESNTVTLKHQKTREQLFQAPMSKAVEWISRSL